MCDVWKVVDIGENVKVFAGHVEHLMKGGYYCMLCEAPVHTKNTHVHVCASIKY